MISLMMQKICFCFLFTEYKRQITHTDHVINVHLLEDFNNIMYSIIQFEGNLMFLWFISHVYIIICFTVCFLQICFSIMLNCKSTTEIKLSWIWSFVYWNKNINSIIHKWIILLISEGFTYERQKFMREIYTWTRDPPARPPPRRRRSFLHQSVSQSLSSGWLTSSRRSELN